MYRPRRNSRPIIPLSPQLSEPEAEIVHNEQYGLSFALIQLRG